ncbi:MAG: DUF2214 family protein [Bdellovibrionales bacterium]|nr:DUF2214 family protein [Bdellovibrionales bacterium]
MNLRFVFNRFSKKILRDDSCSLATIVSKKFKDESTATFSREELFSILYIPSKRGFSILFFSVFIPNVLFAISKSVNIWDFLPTRCPDHEFWGGTFLHDLFRILFYALPDVGRDSLIAIHTGIGAIIFALLIFAAETLRDDLSKDRARVILRESFLYPLAVVEILVFFSFVFFDANLFSWISVVVVGLLTIFSLSRTISVLLSKNRFLKKRIALLRERLLKSTEFAMRERLSHNELLARLKDERILLQYNPWKPYKDSDDYFVIKTERRGNIVDINLCLLKELAERLEKLGLAKGVTFKSDSNVKTDVGIAVEDGGMIAEAGKTKMSKDQSRYLLKLPFQQISDDDSSLICFKRSLVNDDKDLKILEELAQKTFRFSSEDSFSEEVRRELAGVRDQFLVAMRERDLSTIEDCCEIYKELASGFVTYLQSKGGKYSFDDALKERTSLFGGWTETRWLVEDVRDLMEASIEGENLDVLKKVAYLPIGIAVRAAKRNDHYLFQEFIGFTASLYYLSKRGKTPEIQSYLRDRSARFLKEVVSYYIAPKLKDTSASIEDLKATKDFITYIMILLSELLKAMVDQDDSEMFDSYLRVVLTGLSEDRYFKGRHEVDGLEWQLKHGNVVGEDRERLELRLSRQRALLAIDEEITKRRRQLMFGLGSWLLAERTKKSFFDKVSIHLPTNPIDITELFAETCNFKTEDFWNWDRWEVVADGQVHAIDFHSKLSRLYVLRMLTALSTVSDEQYLNLKLPINRDFSSMCRPDGPLENMIKTFIESRDQWSDYLSPVAFGQGDRLRGLLADVVKRQDIADADEKINTNISPEVVDKFRHENVRAYKERVRLRPIISTFGRIDSQANDPTSGKGPRFGISIVDDKATFFEEWHVHYMGRDDHYGEQMSSGEDATIYKKIAAKCELKSESIEAIINSLAWKADAVLLCTRMASRSLYKLNGFVPSWHRNSRKLEIENLAGTIELDSGYIPVFEIYTRDSSAEAIILNKNKFPSIEQKWPLDKDESREFVIDHFYFRVQQFSGNESLLKDMLDKPSKWLVEIGNKDAQRRHLEERALIHFFQRFCVVFPDGFDGVKCRIEEEE